MCCGQCSASGSVSLTTSVCSACCRVASVGSSACVHSTFNSFAAFAKPAGGYRLCKLLVAVTAFLSCLICGCGCCNSVAACAKAACNDSCFTKRRSQAVFGKHRKFLPQKNFTPHFLWLENSLPVAQCLGSLNLNWVFLIIIISCILM